MKAADVVGRNIKAHRIRCGMTQVHLAKDIETSNVVISRWERGLLMPSFGKFLDLAACFGVQLDDLTSGVTVEHAV